MINHHSDKYIAGLIAQLVLWTDMLSAEPLRFRL